MQKSRTYGFDYLKAFIILLVVAHHSALAYTTFASFNKSNYVFSTAPIVDSQRWIGLDFFQGFNDIFFMSLMFFIAGLFSWKSLARKGALTYLKDRFFRLGIPFLIGVTLVIPIAEYPSYLMSGQEKNYLYFWRNVYFQNYWFPGPPWFLWILFAFSFLLVLVKSFTSRLFIRLSAIIENYAEKPIKEVAWFTLFAFGAYAIPYLLIPQGKFSSWMSLGGPLWFQSNRIFLYALFFFTGVAVGVFSYQKLMKENSTFVRHWLFWMSLSIFLYLIDWFFIRHLSSPLIYCLFFASICTTASAAFIGLFCRYVNTYNPVFQSLADNAYGIYLLHYPFVIWFQYALLNVEWAAAFKFILVLLGSLISSWISSWLLRSLLFVKKFL